jgi:23S rRNA (cytidine1920-2'-O)/16S rRNA (cytidine1409-2'-O)-methyltransferase
LVGISQPFDFCSARGRLCLMAKVRLDTLLVRQGLAESHRRAQSLIMAGQVIVEDHVMDKPGARVPETAQVIIREKPRYVSRGGIKLEHALARFQISVVDRVVADIGASTGGFIDCLLQKGARKVYVDSLPEPVDLATVDVSFISLALVLPRVANLLRPEGEIVALIKPQFEAPRDRVAKGGVVRDPEVHRTVIEKVAVEAIGGGLRLRGLTPSPLRGPAGNVEFFCYLSRDERLDSISIEEAVDACLNEAASLLQPRGPQEL